MTVSPTFVALAQELADLLTAVAALAPPDVRKRFVSKSPPPPARF
jgi:hypothetical protein